ncbi:MAG: hypothetical protein A3H59_03715 [Candidatus Jacksonbacteria bacterium RIFCSPLOWO2_02_FULL_43_9]|nr:MAG: hypothetical protein UV70_C0010G0043 [Parcubacteria group bacterium GW2011_GWA2_43_13]OGY69694.1 MAG: hypothetical protein A3B94_02435 [Candidatus Jacksonbacteria bacterium RIFCSPHIGHO2_02_FULL_43_10]OGY70714.1 MAG: hypothetical protein A2986_03000 [Candidatus Jacksonbacteria bacterium RIFCSPLOWO2_01_FULL_44_13]OGY74306.1 MAG: hypothetical protein A3H59_03715 [Candidatus Jacksonbacteria bacterium RIFCSPLOWO2_02_FULL_43_9]HAZ16691.1 hypothetical protein [Candidatus Jacksonbacteria bacter
MGLLSEQDIIGLRVITKMGTHIGKVLHVVIDADTLEIAKIEVRPSNLAKALVRGALMIPRSSIISIDKDGVIVQDAVIVAKEQATVSSAVAAMD